MAQRSLADGSRDREPVLGPVLHGHFHGALK